MENVVINMPTIIFSGVKCTKMVITPSARKHWEDRSEEIYRYIFPSLNSYDHEPDWLDRDGTPCYRVTSCTSVFPSAPQMYRPHRDTCFRFYRSTGTIEFFHGSPRKESWYSRSDKK
jgi:hypothetical protein